MAIKPSGRIPTWATAGGADIVDPGAPQQADGWDVDDKPPAGWLNWWQNRVGAWTDYVSQLADQDLRSWFDARGESLSTATIVFSCVFFHEDGGGTGIPLGMAMDADGRAFVSRDGRQWVYRGQAAGSGSAPFRSVFFDPAIGWITVGSNSEVSTDFGATWTTGGATGSVGTRKSIAGNGAGILVTLTTTGDISSSPDGLVWTSRLTTALGLRKIVFANGLFVATGCTSAGNSTDVYTSPDGIAWTDRSALFPDSANSAVDLKQVIYSAAAGKWFANAYIGSGASDSAPIIYSTTDPTSVAWTAAHTSALHNDVATFGGFGSAMLEAPDGRLVALYGVFSYASPFAGGDYLSGAGFAIVSSDDGATWAEFEIPAIDLYDAAAFGSCVVRVGGVANDPLAAASPAIDHSGF